MPISGVRYCLTNWSLDFKHNVQKVVHSSAIHQTIDLSRVSGPILIIIAINDLFHAAPMFNYILFADDTNIF